MDMQEATRNLKASLIEYGTVWPADSRLWNAPFANAVRPAGDNGDQDYDLTDAGRVSSMFLGAFDFRGIRGDFRFDAFTRLVAEVSEIARDVRRDGEARLIVDGDATDELSGDIYHLAYEIKDLIYSELTGDEHSARMRVEFAIKDRSELEPRRAEMNALALVAVQLDDPDADADAYMRSIAADTLRSIVSLGLASDDVIEKSRPYLLAHDSLDAMQRRPTNVRPL